VSTRSQSCLRGASDPVSREHLLITGRTPGGGRLQVFAGLAITFILLLFWACAGYACTCLNPNPICMAYWESPVIFRGRVVRITDVPDEPKQTVKNLDGTTSTIIGPGTLNVRFQVIEVFRGTISWHEIIVRTSDQLSACGFPFETGREYVVFTYADRKTRKLWTNRCMHTHELEPGKADADLTWMRALPTAPAGATIFGSVFLFRDRQAMPVAAKIRIRGPESREIASDNAGHFSFSGLEPGAYTVSATVRSQYLTGKARTITVPNKGCAQEDWTVFYNSKIGGQVTDSAGRAMPGISLGLAEHGVAGPTEWVSSVDFAETDRQGRYSFKSAPPGDYLVIVNPFGPSPRRPYPRIFYPDVQSSAEAKAIHLGPSATVENVDLRLPNAWKRVAVHARVLLPDGSPAAGAEVSAYDIGYLWSGEPATAIAHADGRATLPVYDGRSYYLEAMVFGGTQQRCAGPLKFTAKNGLSLEPITILHNWGNCLAQLNPAFRPPAAR
jgi:hypothetical protein